ncbi:MAG: hypothetical protein M3O03_00545 [Pseudomonadota bacterium]|nr:hypothetical protein [Pseudomonadota bacterium]
MSKHKGVTMLVKGYNSFDRNMKTSLDPRSFWASFNEEITVMINKKLGLAAAVFLTAAVFSTTGAMAKVFSIPATDAVATVNAPDDWEPSDIDDGIEMNSPDGGIYVSIESIKADKITDALTESMTVLADQGLVVDATSQKTKDIEANGLKIHNFEYTAKDDDGPTEFAVSLIETRVPDQFVMMTFWGAADAQKANDAAVSAMLQSVQLTK